MKAAAIVMFLRFTGRRMEEFNADCSNFSSRIRTTHEIWGQTGCTEVAM
jgi:hypothetical protein